MPSNLRDGIQLDLFGRAVVPANRSASPERVAEPTTSGTFGPRCAGSSASAALQSSLENRLRVLLDVNGSPEYVLTWKHWAMPSGQPICALRASGRRTSDSGFTGWLSPITPSGGRSVSTDKMSSTGVTLDGRKHTVSLEHVVKFAGWRPPDTSDRGGAYTDPEKVLTRMEAGHQVNLEDQAVLAGWPTATAKDAANAANAANATATRQPGSQHHAGTTLVDAARLAGWSTPRAEDSESTGAHRGTPDTLTSQSRLTGWATPTTRDHKDGASTLENTPTNALLGRQCQLSPAPTEKRGALNPAFSRWLQGYPKRWCEAAIRASRSMPTRRRKRA